MGRGVVDNAHENEIRTGNATFKDRHLGKEENQQRSMDNHFVPLTKNLQDNVQNPMNLVEEVNCHVWVRGGVPSRQIVKDLDYYYRSKDSEKYKEYISRFSKSYIEMSEFYYGPELPYEIYKKHFKKNTPYLDSKKGIEEMYGLFIFYMMAEAAINNVLGGGK